jgi:hypothetical protein
MAQLRSLPLALLTGALLCASALFSASNLIAQSFAPTVRIVDRINESNLVTLKGNTHPAANAKNDRGRVSSTLPMTDLILVLSRSPEQQAAFDKFVASQYDSASPDFHKWLTPEQVGENFGPSQTDVATISNWLTGHGFSVDEVTKDHMSIRFSGTAAQVESAFHTEIHNLEVKGVAHIGNMTDPQIPAALAPAIVGVKALHNFFPRPAHHMGSQVTRDSETGKWKRLTSLAPARSTLNSVTLGGKTLAAAKPAAARPQFGINVPADPTTDTSAYLVEDVGPWDFATIYNILPLWNKTTPIDGTGQTIAIAGTSDIDVGQSTAESGANGNNDVATFRSFFDLPTNIAANTPKRISGNSEALTVCTDTTGEIPYPDNPCGIDDLTENSLDVEWSGSIAKNAQIILVASYPASASDDNLYDSESYIVNHLTAPIMNVSYGECELSNGTAGNVEYYDMWQTAATEGIAVFVAAGDSGSASCDDDSFVAESGLTVSGLASTPYNTAVGGTDFNWCSPDTANGSAGTECAAAPYWNSTTNSTTEASVNASGPQSGYVRETPWNETCTNPLTLSWVQDIAKYFYGYSTSESSGVSNTEQACNFLLDYDFNYYDGYYGLANETYGYPYIEYLLETVGGSGGASNCVVGTPVYNSTTGAATGCSAGATSTGSTTNPDTRASQASIPLHNNGWPKPSWQTGVSGIPSDGVRDLPDVSFFASDGYVSSSAYLICASANNDNAQCSYSNPSVVFYQEVGGTSVATPAMAGVMALINQKTGASQGFANPELYKLAATQTYSECSAESVSASSTTCMFNDIDQGTNAMPCDDGIYTSTTYTTPNCTASYSTPFLGVEYPDSVNGLGILTGYSAAAGYDLASGLGSLNVANVVNNWVSSIGKDATTITVSPSPNPVSESQSLNVTVTVASNPSGGTTPTGSVTLTGGGYTSATEALSSSGSYVFTIPAGSLSGGTITLTANYTGDGNYASSSGTGSVTVNKLTATVTALPAPASIESNQQVVVTGTVACSGSCTGSATPTGTVIVSYGTTYASQQATLSSGQYSVTITPNSLPGGTDVLTVTYSGDDNYASANTTATVSVTFFQVLTPTMTVTPASTTVDSGSPLLVTVSMSCTVPPNASCTGAATPTGTVTLTGSGYALTSVTLTNGVAQFNIPANTLTFNPNFPSSDTLTADYEGDADYAQVAGTTTLTVTQSGYSLSATAITNLTPGATTGNTSTVTVNSPSDYTGTVTFTSAECVLTGYPTGVTASTPSNPTCALSGSGTVTMAPGSDIGTVTYAVSTSSATTASVIDMPSLGRSTRDSQLAKAPSTSNRPAARSDCLGWFGAAGGSALAALFLFLVPGGSRKWRKMFSAFLLIASIAFTTVGCGGGGSSTPPTLATPTVTVTATPSSVTLGSSSTVSIQVTVSGSDGTPTGSVSFSGGGYSSASEALTSGTYTFSVPASSFTTVGSDPLTASYSGDTNYNSGSGTGSITVNNVPTTAGTYTFTVTPTSTPSFAAQPSTAFTVTVN